MKTNGKRINKKRARNSNVNRISRPLKLADRTYPFKRMTRLGLINLNGDNVDTIDLGAFSFYFAQLPDYSDFTTLFDKYVIDSVKLEFLFPCITQNTVIDHLKWPKIYTVLDYDDDNTPVSLDEIMQYQSLKLTQYTDSQLTHNVNLVPRVSRPVYNGVSVVAAYEVAPPHVWIDLNSTGVPHYGLKYAIEYNMARKVDVEVRLTMNFRCSMVR
jgi:hypothetical protein